MLSYCIYSEASVEASLPTFFSLKRKYNTDCFLYLFPYLSQKVDKAFLPKFSNPTCMEVSSATITEIWVRKETSLSTTLSLQQRKLWFSGTL